MKSEIEMSQAATTELIDAWRLEVEITSPPEHEAIYQVGKDFLIFMEQELAGSKISLRSDAAWSALENLTQTQPFQAEQLQNMILDYQSKPFNEETVLRGFSILDVTFDNGVEDEVSPIAFVATGVAPNYISVGESDLAFKLTTHMFLSCHELTHILLELEEYPLELREAVCDYYTAKFFGQRLNEVIFQYEIDEAAALNMIMKKKDVAISSQEYELSEGVSLRRHGSQWHLTVDALKYYLNSTYDVNGESYSRLVHTRKFERLEKRFGPKVLEVLMDPNHAKPAYQRWLIRYLLTAAFFNQTEQRA